MYPLSYFSPILTFMFSCMRCGLELLGMTMMPLCTVWRSRIWAVVLLWRAAIDLTVSSASRSGSGLPVMRDSHLEPGEPRGEYAVTLTPRCLQKSTSGRCWW